MILDDWHRLEKIVKWTGMSTNAFALHIGLHRSENLYRIKRGDNGISKDLAETIAKCYPELSRAWILTGEGNMFVSENHERFLIPAYDVDAVQVVQESQPKQAAYSLSIPRAGQLSFAALMLNKSMEPDIPVGSTLLLAETSVEDIIPGYPYLVATDRIAAVRMVLPTEDGAVLRLTAANPVFGDIEVDTASVRSLYLVKGHIHYNM